MAGTMKNTNKKASVAMKATGKQHGGNGVAKKQTAIKGKSAGGVNTPPKGAVPMTKPKAIAKKGGMTKSMKKK
jgi:hypothetical protein